MAVSSVTQLVCTNQLVFNESFHESLSSQPNQHEQNGNQPQIHWEEQHHEDSGQPDIPQQADPRRNPHQHHDQGSVICWQQLGNRETIQQRGKNNREDITTRPIAP